MLIGRVSQKSKKKKNRKKTTERILIESADRIISASRSVRINFSKLNLRKKKKTVTPEETSKTVNYFAPSICCIFSIFFKAFVVSSGHELCR